MKKKSKRIKESKQEKILALIQDPKIYNIIARSLLNLLPGGRLLSEIWEQTDDLLESQKLKKSIVEIFNKVLEQKQELTKIYRELEQWKSQDEKQQIESLIIFQKATQNIEVFQENIFYFLREELSKRDHLLRIFAQKIETQGKQIEILFENFNQIEELVQKQLELKNNDKEYNSLLDKMKNLLPEDSSSSTLRYSVKYAIQEYKEEQGHFHHRLKMLPPSKNVTPEKKQSDSQIKFVHQLFMQMNYHLSGLTIWTPSSQDPLLILPFPIRFAILSLLEQNYPFLFNILEKNETPLQENYEYTWYPQYFYNTKQLYEIIQELLQRRLNETLEESPSESAIFGKSLSVVLNILKGTDEEQNIFWKTLNYLLEDIPQQFQFYQKWLLLELDEAIKQGKQEIVFSLGDSFCQTSQCSIFLLTLIDFQANITKVKEFAFLEESIELPQIYIDKPFKELKFNLLVEDILLNFILKNFDYRDIKLYDQKQYDKKSLKIPPNFKEETGKRIIPQIKEKIKAHNWSQLPASLPQFHATERTLDYFARRFFPIAKLKREQVILLKKAFQQESILGILPTGFGKSLIFQLYSLLTPRLTIVISPLRSLIVDQNETLHERGFRECTTYLIGEHGVRGKEQYIFRTIDKFRLLYLTPERMLIQKFWEKLDKHKRYIGALVVDEAHCVSEWGHDFRPAYLQIHRLHEDIKQKQPQSPMFAFTATASRLVREDISAILNIEEKNIVRLSHSDRPEISLSAHPYKHITSAPIASFISENIPQILKMNHEEALWERKHSAYKHLGLIFSIYANPTGKTTRAKGIRAVQDQLKKEWGREITSQRSRIFASRVASFCPKCGNKNHLLFDLQNQQIYCPKCDADIIEADKKENFEANKGKINRDWKEYISAAHRDFKRSQFPLMIATKGFGMGIDIPNIRYVIHTSLSGSVSSYYQEIGRVARDGKHAHAALFFHDLHPQCWKALQKDPHPECMKNPEKKKFYECSFDSSKNHCDYAHQAQWIDDEYPDTKNIIGAFQRLDSQYFITSQCYRRDKILKIEPHNYKISIAGKKRDADEIVEKYLLRLQQIGILEYYQTHYELIQEERFRRSFHIKPNKTDKNIILEQFANQLQKLNISPEEIQHIIDKLPNPENEWKKYIDRALEILINQINATIPVMRYQMLFNLVTFAYTKHCRRVLLRSIFDEDKLEKSDYRCEFCDICVPDLNFTRTEAAPLISTREIEDFHQYLFKRIDEKDLSLLEEDDFLLERSAELDIQESLLGRISSFLEDDSTNLPARFIAACLTEAVGKKDRALFHLKAGLDEARRQGQNSDIYFHFYRRAYELDPSQADRWLFAQHDSDELMNIARTFEKYRFHTELISPIKIFADLQKIHDVFDTQTDKLEQTLQKIYKISEKIFENEN